MDRSQQEGLVDSVRRRWQNSPPARIIHRFVQVLTHRERWILGVATGLIMVAGLGLVWTRLPSQSTLGLRTTYREGIVATSPADIEPTVTALTHAALLRPGSDGSLVGELADRWQLTDDARSIEFTLKPAIDRSVVLAALTTSETDSPLTGLTVTPGEDQAFTVSQSDQFSPLLGLFTKPLIPIGPFVVAHRTKEQITLVARPDYALGRAKLQTIELMVYPTVSALERAIERHQVDGVNQWFPSYRSVNGFRTYQLTLPRKTAAFFNLDRPVLQSVDVRRALSDRTALPSPSTFTVVTTDTLAALPVVQALIADWQKTATITLSVLPAARVQTEIIPSRTYDVLIFGIDEGAVADPYLFWHSSQRKLTGLNLSNLASIDADRAVEGIRKTASLTDRQRFNDQLATVLTSVVPWVVLDPVPWQFAVDTTMSGVHDLAGFTPADRYRDVVGWHR